MVPNRICIDFGVIFGIRVYSLSAFKKLEMSFSFGLVSRSLFDPWDFQPKSLFIDLGVDFSRLLEPLGVVFLVSCALKTRLKTHGFGCANGGSTTDLGPENS